MSRGSFRRISSAKTAEPGLGDKLHRATLRTVEKRAHLIAEIPEWETLRRKAREIRLAALDRREKLLDRFARRLEERGARVTIVRSRREAADAVVALARQAGGEVIKSKSMATEEIGLNAALEAAGVTVTETDLGEWIVQQARQAPSHITAPAIHLSVEDIARIFHERAGTPLPDWIPPSPPATGHEPPVVPQATREALARELSLTARGLLRERFLRARVGITGANFLVAESGTIVLLENEGNIRLTTSLPARQIVVAGIEKLVARDEDLAVLLRLLPVSATAQRQSAYVSLLADRHPDLHVVLLDRGRSRLAKDRDQRDLLTCIRCGACLNACPVYRRRRPCLRGCTAADRRPAAPHFDGADRHPELPFASTSAAPAARRARSGSLPRAAARQRARLVRRGLACELVDDAPGRRRPALARAAGPRRSVVPPGPAVPGRPARRPALDGRA